MKKLLLLFSVVLSVSTVKAQSDVSVMLETNAGTSAAITSASDESFIATLPSGEDLVATRVKDAGVEYINVKKIHLDGSVTTLANISAAEPLLGLSCASSGNFTVFYGQATAFYLAKFTPTGSVLWQKSFTVGEPVVTYYAHTMKETPAGDYYLTVSNYSWTGLVKIDANGNVLWSKKMTGPRDTGKCPGFCSAVTNTGGCVTTLKDENYETIINMDGNGNMLWSRSFGDMSYRWTKSIKADNLGNFYIMGTYGNTGATFFQKMDASGTMIYAKNLSSSLCFEDAYVTASNDLYLMTQYPNFNLCKVSSDGNILWSRGIGGLTPVAGMIYPSAPVFFTSTPLQSKLIFRAMVNDSVKLIWKLSDISEACNTYNNPGMNVTDDAQIFDATIDMTANINPLVIADSVTAYTITSTEYYSISDFCSFIASVNEVTSTELMVFPNPADDQITIQLGNIKNSPDAIATIYDMTGRKVFESKPDNAVTMSLSTSGLAPGIYNLVITDGQAMLGKQRIVIQR